MKSLNTLLYMCIGAAIALGMSACNAHDQLDHDHHHHGHEHEHEGEGHDDGEEIILNPDAAARFGVSTDTVRAGEFCEILEVAGRLEESPEASSVVSAPTSGIVRFAPGIAIGKQVAAGTAVATVSASGMTGGDPNVAAKAALDAAKKEVDRMKPLYEEGIVSARDYNAAVAAYEQARAAYSGGAASGRALAATSGVITSLLVQQGSYVEAGAPIATVSGTRKLTLRAEVPEKYYASVPTFTSAKIKLPYADAVIDLKDMGGSRVSSGNTAVSVTPGYIPVYFTFTNDGSALPGGYVQVYLEGAPRQDVITLPVEALYEQQGNFYVYERLDEEGYRKVAVLPGASDGRRVEIRQGLHPGMEVVVTGTTAVRLAETSAVAPEGHSHNH